MQVGIMEYWNDGVMGFNPTLHHSKGVLMPEPMGFYTDTTVCIGCKACEVACKEWNQLPSTNGGQNTLSC